MMGGLLAGEARPSGVWGQGHKRPCQRGMQRGKRSFPLAKSRLAGGPEGRGAGAARVSRAQLANHRLHPKTLSDPPFRIPEFLAPLIRC